MRWRSSTFEKFLASTAGSKAARAGAPASSVTRAHSSDVRVMTLLIAPEYTHGFARVAAANATTHLPLRGGRRRRAPRGRGARNGSDLLVGLRPGQGVHQDLDRGRPL